MATRGGKPASRRGAQKSVRPKTIDLKAADAKPETESKAGAKPASAPAGRASPVPNTNVKSGNVSLNPKASSSSDGKKPIENAKKHTDKPADKPKSAPKDNSTTAPKASASSGGNPPSSEPQPSPGFGMLAASAIVGGVITAGGLGLIGQFNNAASLPVIGSLYSASDSRTNTEALSILQSNTSELNEKVESLEKAASEEPTIDAAALENRLADLEKDQIGTTSDATTALAQTNARAIDQITQRVSELGKGISAAPSIAEQPELEELRLAIANLSSKVSTISGNVSTVSSEQVGALTKKLNGLVADMESFKQSEIAAADDLRNEFNNSIATTTTRIDTIDKTLNDQVISRLDEVVGAAEKATVSEKIARSVAVSSLQSAIDNGTPYLNAVTSIETLGGTTKEIKRLRELSSLDSIPTVTQLQKTFDGIATRLINPVEQAQEGDGLINRFVASAKSLVSVRPSEPQQGSTPTAVVSRIEASLEEGKLGEVIEEWALLPEASREIGQTWFENLKLRQETNQLLKLVLKQASVPGSQG